jgi:hypothetical protein
MGAATAAGVAAAHNHGLLLKNKQDALAVPDPIDSGLKPWTVTGVLPDRERKQINFEGKVYVAPLTTVGKILFLRKGSFCSNCSVSPIMLIMLLLSCTYCTCLVLYMCYISMLMPLITVGDLSVSV